MKMRMRTIPGVDVQVPFVTANDAVVQAMNQYDRADHELDHDSLMGALVSPGFAGLDATLPNVWASMTPQQPVKGVKQPAKKGTAKPKPVAPTVTRPASQPISKSTMTLVIGGAALAVAGVMAFWYFSKRGSNPRGRRR